MKFELKTNALIPNAFFEIFTKDHEQYIISTRDIEKSSGKLFFELAEMISKRICELPIERSRQFWSKLDKSTKSALILVDSGKFNIDLILKLELNGQDLYDSFCLNFGRQMDDLNCSHLASEEYVTAFTTLQQELLMLSRQLNTDSVGRELLIDFLEKFDLDFLASLLTHEIARFYFDSNLQELYVKFDNSPYLNIDDSKEMTDLDCIIYDKADYGTFDSELLKFSREFNNPQASFPHLEFTHWLHSTAPEIYKTVHQHLLFLCRERNLCVWDRPNPRSALKQNIETVKNLADQQVKNNLKESRFGKRQEDNKTYMNTSVQLFGEPEGFHENRISNLYVEYALKKELSNPERLEQFGKRLAKLIVESGNGQFILNFEDLRSAVWKCTEFSKITQWLNLQKDPTSLVISSGQQTIINDMKTLGPAIFDTQYGIIQESLNLSIKSANLLLSWLSLVAAMEHLSSKRINIKYLADTIDDHLQWSQELTCSTLILQITLGVEKLRFSLDDLKIFCTTAKQEDWMGKIEQSICNLLSAKHNLGYEILREYASRLKAQSESIFCVAENILIDSVNQELVNQIKDAVDKEWRNMLTEISYVKELNVDTVLRNSKRKFINDIKNVTRDVEFRSEAIAYYEYVVSPLSEVSF